MLGFGSPLGWLWFQSLFWWILYCDFWPSTSQASLNGCFNPCFGGSYIVTSFRRWSKRDRKQFQSLFWWILYCDDRDGKEYDTLVTFQSLFWWILYCDYSNCHPACLLFACFNPCFGGSYIVTNLGMSLGLMTEGFNPCFGGSYIVTLPVLPHSSIHPCFNPCFGGSYIVTPGLLIQKNI